MKESHITHPNQTTNNSYTNWLWNYGKQALKGIGVMGLGMLGYVGLRGYWQRDSTTIQAKSENTDLVPSQHAQALVADKGLTSTTSSSVVGQNIWDTAGQSVQYRPKRGAVSKTRDSQVKKRSLSGNNSIGIEFQVNNFTLFNQKSPAIATLSNGDFVIVWSSEGQDGDREGIFAQIFASDGSRLGYEFQVNTYYIEAQVRPEVAALANNKFVVVWQSYNQDFSYFGVYGQIFNSTGNKVGDEFLINTFYVLDQQVPTVAAMPNGNFMVVWESLGQATPNSPDVYGQVFNSSGARIGSEFKVNSDNNGDWPSITLLKDNTFVVAWHTVTPAIDTSGFGCAGQRFDAVGNKSSIEFAINNYTQSNQVWPRLSALPNGGFVATWMSFGQVGSNWSIHAQQFNNSGYKFNNEFQANTYIGNQQFPAVIALTDGSFVITWHSDLQDGSSWGVYAQWFDSNSNKLGREFQVNAYTQDSQASPRLTQLANGNIVITWQSYGQDGSNSGCVARVLTPSLLPFVYNLNIPKLYTESIHYQFSDVIVNPMVDADLLNLTLTLSDPTLGTLNQPNAGNVTATYNNSTGIWFVSGTVVEVNKVLSQLVLTPTLYYNGNIDIGVFLVDGVHPNFNGTLNFQGIPVNNPPELQTNYLYVNQGIPTLLTQNNLKATDVDNDPNNLVFFADLVLQGQFELVSTPNRAIFNFTQAQVLAGLVRFVHDNTVFSPSYQISVSDGFSKTVSQSATIDFNARPILLTNMLSIQKGETVIMNSTHLNATDDRTPWENLIFRITDIAHGHFESLDNQTATLMSFTQQSVNTDKIRFIHDGSNNPPGYFVLVDDGQIYSPSIPASVNFIGSDQNLIARDNTTVGVAVGATGAGLLLSGLGIFGAYRYRRSKQLEEQRSNYPLANAFYHELNIPGTEDFQSEKGIAFTNAVNSLNNELIRAGIDIKQMVPEEISELAHKLANATKAQLGKKINPLDIQDYAQGIVATAMTLSGKRKLEGGDVELDVVVRGGNRGRKLLLDALDARLEQEGFDMQTLSAERLKLLTEQCIKIIQKDFVESDTQTTTDSQTLKAWRPGL